MQENNYISPSSLKTMLNVIEDMRVAIKELESRVNTQNSTLELLRAELERQILVDERTSKELHRFRQEIDSIKTSGEECTTANTSNIDSAEQIKVFNTPVMNGAGFSHITAGYLKSIGKK